MRILVASDIHGSAYFCRFLMERIEEEDPDRIILLGDHLYHGPRNDLPKEYDPKSVLTMLNGIKDKIIAVRGNCDSEVDQMVLEFATMADYTVIDNGRYLIYATHGHVYNQNNPIKGVRGILLCGHTHVPACEEYDDFVYINPGSISIPKNDTPHSYMMIEDDGFSWKDVHDGKIYREFVYNR